MSREAVFVDADGRESDGGQVATTRGWGDLIRWCDTLPLEPFENLISLAEWGEIDGDLLPTVADQIDAALRRHPPEVPTVANTARNLAEVIRRGPPGYDLVITDGAG